MNLPLQIFIFIPAIGLLISLFLPRKSEKLISGTAYYAIGLHLLCSVATIIYWFINGHPIINIRDLVVFRSNEYEFFLDFYFDKVTAVYLFVGSFLTFLVTVYSKIYMHREEGYKRFFNSILFFYMGYNITIFSGNFETLFIGWEILGISSFILIAFYRDRYLPVRNAIKVYSVYRIGDIGILLAMWASHHLWHENITFLQLQNYTVVHHQLESHSWIGIFISLMILLSATAKSAQLPFSSWLPRAMEGPTPSSAIFYGSLSVHIGVFLLLKTFPFWEHQLSVRIFIGFIGLTTAIVSTGIARVQSSIKSQIAYSSITQIGYIFIEVAAGFENLALFHFAGNAFLRTYQLLVSPSVVSYLIKEQFYEFIPRQKTVFDFVPKKIRYTIYVLGIKEWNLGRLMNNLYWEPLKAAGNSLNFLSFKRVLIILAPIYFIFWGLLFFQNIIPKEVLYFIPGLLAFIGLCMILKSFTERKRVRIGWIYIIMSHFWVALALCYNAEIEAIETIIYLSGIIIAGAVGFGCLLKLKSTESNINLDRFRGHSYEHPILALVFLLCSLGISGFPITPTFVGEDLYFSHIREDQFILATFLSIGFILNGLSVIRIFARVFLGPHMKSYHELAYRSS